jgi:hypothetical protein
MGRQIKPAFTPVLFIPALLIVSGWISCYHRMKVPVSEFNPKWAQDIEQVTVYKLDGTEIQFVSGWVKDQTFFGLDESYAIQEIPTAEISHFVIRTFSKSQTTVLATSLVAPLSFVGLVMSSMSCPHVYSSDGSGWTLDAEPFSGAIARSAMTTDYSTLGHIRPTGGYYAIRYVNESEEIEFTDEVRLVTVDHEGSVTIVPGPDGELVSLGDVRPPFFARSRTGEDLLKRMNGAGELFWEGNPDIPYADPSKPREEIHLKFQRPAGAGSAKLILKGQNTLWGFHIMVDFMTKFGSLAKKKLDKMNDDPRGKEKVESFMKKFGVWIEVLVRKDGAWQRAGYIRESGPSVAKTQVFRIDLSAVTGETVEVKLRWAPLFWSILGLGMDFTEDGSNLVVNEESPHSAVDSRQGDIRAIVLEKDGAFYKTHKGDEALMTFEQPAMPEGAWKRTVILKTSGYYNLVFSKSQEGSTLEKMNLILKKKGIDVYSLEQLKRFKGK